MSFCRSIVFSLLILLSFSQFQGCAPVTATPDVDPVLAAKEAIIQKRMAVEAKLEDRWRLRDVAGPILIHGAPLCGDEVGYFIGMDTGSLDEIPKEWKAAYKDVLGLDEQIKVIHVVPGSPADLAGLKSGDVILMVNGKKVESGEKASKKFREGFGELSEVGKGVSFWIERGGQQQLVDVAPIMSCSYPVVVTEDAVVNAYATGSEVMVTKGMMDFIRKDEELALIIGHELGHNVMGHIAKKTGNRMLGAILDGLLAGVSGVHTNVFTNAAGMMYSQDFEREADYLGMYFMERGGFDSQGAPMFWRRMGASFPYAISHATTHPTSASRYVFLEECAKEIAGKKDAGEPLKPNFKDKIAAK